MPAQAARRRPQIWHGAKADVHKQACQLDARAERTPEPEHAEATTEPTQDRCLEGNIPVSISDGNAEERGVRFGGDAMDLLFDPRVQPIICGLERCIGLREPRQGQLLAHRAEPSYRVQRDADRRCARLAGVGRRSKAAQLRVKFMASGASTTQAGPPFTGRWQHMERQELNGHATQDISCSWPVDIALIEEQLPASRDAIASDA